MTTTNTYTPFDVNSFASRGNVKKMILALNQGNNSTEWYYDDYGMSALHIAAGQNHQDCAREILDRDFDINTRANSGATAFIQASHEGHVNMAKLLMEGHADYNLRRHDGATALDIASSLGKMGIVELISEKDDIDINNRSSNGLSALHRACQGGYIDIVAILLSRGFNINSKSALSETSLMHTACNRYLTIVVLLLEKNANMNIKNVDGKTALHWAIILILLRLY